MKHVLLAQPAHEIAHMLFISVINVPFLVTGCVHIFGKRNSCYSRLSDDDHLSLHELISYNFGIYQRGQPTELQNTWSYSGCMTIFHTVRKLGSSYQQQYMAEISALYPAMWIDETTCDRRNALDHFGYSYHHRTTNFN